MSRLLSFFAVVATSSAIAAGEGDISALQDRWMADFMHKQDRRVEDFAKTQPDLPEKRFPRGTKRAPPPKQELSEESKKMLDELYEALFTLHKEGT